MKIILLYHPASDHGRTVEEYVHEFMFRNPEVELEAISVDTKEGADKTKVYDVVMYPSMLALREDGSLAQVWQGLPLPLMNEVAYFTIA